MQLTSTDRASRLCAMDGNAATLRFYKLLGIRIADLRNASKLTQAELAERIGSARTSITNLEGGRQQMPLHQLLRIAEVLQVDLKDLIPSRDEVHTQERIPVVIGTDQKEVSPATARLITSILDGREGAYNDSRGKSNRPFKRVQDPKATGGRRSDRTKRRS